MLDEAAQIAVLISVSRPSYFYRDRWSYFASFMRKGRLKWATMMLLNTEVCILDKQMFHDSRNSRLSSWHLPSANCYRSMAARERVCRL
ncbi:hypothetical protein [Motiliproteus sp. MSK22-1]|uniref:hypothetical protein n=1 Tax=Motiliproteus sp. MSK22-1 TaxID=1897630 RepID=UPI00117F2D20|nr:hypothetical protein [Motiliproteus sp. MSK22-1]